MSSKEVDLSHDDYATQRTKINVCDIEKLLGPSRKIDSELSRRGGSDLISFMQNFAKEMKGRQMAEHTIIRGKHTFTTITAGTKQHYKLECL